MKRMKILNIYKSLGYYSYQFINYLNNYIIRNVESESDFDIEKQMNNRHNIQKIERSLSCDNNNDNSYGFFVILDE